MPNRARLIYRCLKLVTFIADAGVLWSTIGAVAGPWIANMM